MTNNKAKEGGLGKKGNCKAPVSHSILTTGDTEGTSIISSEIVSAVVSRSGNKASSLTSTPSGQFCSNLSLKVLLMIGEIPRWNHLEGEWLMTCGYYVSGVSLAVGSFLLGGCKSFQLSQGWSPCCSCCCLSGQASLSSPPTKPW